MIRILQVVSGLGSGGVENMLFNYISNMDLGKYHFDFVVHDPLEGILERKFIEKGCSIYHVTPKKKSILKNIKEIDQIIRNGNYDIIHCHQNEQSFIPLLLAKFNGIGCRIAHSHVAISKENMKEKTLKFLPKYLTNIFSNHKLSCSSSAGQYLFNNKDYTILYNAINIAKFSYDKDKRMFIRNKFNWGTEYIIGNVSRFYPEKNHEFLLMIFQEILKFEPMARLILIGGEGIHGQKEKVINLINSYGLSDKVSLLGVRSDIPELLQAMDCFVMPSKFEGFGMALIEAQAASLLTYTSDVVPKETRQSELINYISLDESPKKWAEKIMKDKETYKREKESMKFDRFDINREVKILEKFYSMHKM